MCAQSCQTLCNLTDCSPPGSAVHGIFQATTLDQVAISSSREASQPRDRICVSCDSCIGRWVLYHCATWEAHVSCFVSHRSQVKEGVDWVGLLSRGCKEESTSKAYSGCWQNSVPCTCWTEVPFPCWLLVKGSISDVRSHLHMVPSNVKANNNSVSNPFFKYDFSFCH